MGYRGEFGALSGGDSSAPHRYDKGVDGLTDRSMAYALGRIQHKREPLGEPPSAASLNAVLAGAITEDGEPRLTM